jgi:flagellin
MRINQNIMALNAYRNLSTTGTAMSKTLEKLSSGYRINRAADDASGLVISQGLRAQVSGLRQATRNAQDGISVVQTAEGALNEVHSMLNRMRDLAVQASNDGSNDATAKAAAQSELTQLRSEIDRISGSTKFGSQNLLDGTFGVSAATSTGFDANNSITVATGDDFQVNINGVGNVTVELTGGTYTGSAFAAHLESSIKAALTAGTSAQAAFADNVHVSAASVGAGSALTLSIDGLTAGQTFTLTDGTNTPLAGIGMTAVTAAAGTGGTFQVGANASDTISVSISSVTSASLSLSGLDLTASGGASAAITALDTAISNVSANRGALGATQNRFESVINNLQVTTENLAASESRIRDTDYAQEMVTFTRHQILSQAGTAMLGQANQLPQSILSLLRG